MQSPRPTLLPASAYFTRDFNFYFHRVTHTPEQYNESSRHQREFWKIIYIVKGTGQKIINDNRYPVQPGGLFLIHPNDSTTYIIDPPQIEICNILFQPDLIKDGLKELNDDYGFFSILRDSFQRSSSAHELLYVSTSDHNIDRLIKNLEEEHTKKQINYRYLIRLNMIELLIRLARKSLQRKRRHDTISLAQYVDHVIAEHFHEEFDLDFLAEQIGISKNHLCRQYKLHTGKTIMDNLRERRLQEAARLLREPEGTISDICFCCGFNDLSYFYRCFAAKNGKNPGDYRRNFE